MFLQACMYGTEVARARYSLSLFKRVVADPPAPLTLRSDRLLLLRVPRQLILHPLQAILRAVLRPDVAPNRTELHLATVTTLEGLLVRLVDLLSLALVDHAVVVGVRVDGRLLGLAFDTVPLLELVAGGLGLGDPASQGEVVSEGLKEKRGKGRTSQSRRRDRCRG